MTTPEERELAKKFEASYLKGLLPDVRVIYLAGIKKGRELEKECTSSERKACAHCPEKEAEELGDDGCDLVGVQNKKVRRIK